MFHRSAYRVLWLAWVLPALLASPVRAAAYRSGTGFVIHPSGLLITCRHVVEHASRIEVFFGDMSYVAVLQATDDQHDLALLRIDAGQALPSLVLARPKGARLGEEARAFGFPLTSELGMNLKVTRGTVSGIETEGNERTLQIDTAVNPGNSGGPLVNDRGVVIGVVTSRYTEATAFGVAVPADLALRLANGTNVGEAASTALDGPELVRRVAPSVAFIRVTPKAAAEPEAPRVAGNPSSADAVKSGTPAAPPVATAPPAVPAAPPTDATSTPDHEASKRSTSPNKLVAKDLSAAVASATASGIPASAGAKSPAVGSTGPVGAAGTTTNGAASTGTSPAVPKASGATKRDSGTPASVGPKPIPVPVSEPAKNPAATDPAPSGKPSAPQVPSPGPAASDTKPEPAIDVDAELARIRKGDPIELPAPQPGAAGAAGTRVEWRIANLTRAPLLVLLRGPEKKAVLLAPGKTETVSLAPGMYEVGGRLEAPNVSPLYSRQTFQPGVEYRSRFRLELPR